MRQPPIGTAHTVEIIVEERFTVPGLLPEIASWSAMPPVLGTPMLVAFMEWSALEALAPYLDPGEHSLGVLVEMAHTAPTPVGGHVRATATIAAVEGQQVEFAIVAYDETGVIGEGRHHRAVVDAARFERRLKRGRAPTI